MLGGITLQVKFAKSGHFHAEDNIHMVVKSTLMWVISLLFCIIMAPVEVGHEGDTYNPVFENKLYNGIISFLK
jgi:hypothetical protein